MSRRKRAKVDYAALAKRLDAEKAATAAGTEEAPEDTAESSTSALLGALDDEEEAKSVYSAEDAEAEAVCEGEEEIEEEEEEEVAEEGSDWRRQLYRWKGKVELVSAEGEGEGGLWVVWSGHWGKKSGSTTQFSSKQRFKVKGPKVGSSEVGLPQEGRYTSEYMMDNDGSGDFKTFVDPPYELRTIAHREKEDVQWCAGAGSNEFG